ncbi:UNVERIFIED_CONTAM: WPP domain-interacting tail-anchored protein 1 [Sesamum angustifolium]|uniref:WPP domain-interacting tail-anchored protein 1 n=1 Tax=Sesamum angustifolium TaxID=2727405 RepID=A0AAW2NIW2_9LAMI
MVSDSIQDRPASIENASSSEVEAESNNIDSLEAVSSGGDATRELESAVEVLTRVELDLACSSEKLVNLEILVMHVDSRENDFEDFASEEEHKSEGHVEKALEFDLLYGFLDSEVRELESFLTALQTEIAGFQAPFKQLGDSFKEMEEKLQDCEDSLKRSFDQVAGLKVQSANFRRILLASSGDEKCNVLPIGKDDKSLENDNFEDSNAKIRMRTAEQQRNILRMLEKSSIWYAGNGS